MVITNAQYTTDGIDTDINANIKATIDGVEMFVPLDTTNRHYAEILRQVEAGTLTVQEAQ